MKQNNKARNKANERLPFVKGKIMVLPQQDIHFAQFLC